ncbi:hypothetical protein ACONUD_11985 [Microbulbifer harenosus]|uniref:RiboL-PSP-HEPN domain-containing protein n=1 Tax=Microbulbifer harenosus TaxID=2576840 RepID=A0ABY2UH65_9GAMM|nr:hypothetical protein [Microbulbifer harenosus]TLM77188.1 hypothetical protein FDY93_09585 [Microbulbifer harenosus]
MIKLLGNEIMPTIFEAKMDGSNAVRYFHISMVRFYLDQAYENCLKAKEDCQEGLLLASSVIGIVFSAMSIESFVNEICEDVVSKEDLKDFIHLRKSFRKEKGESSVAAKLRILFNMKFNQNLPDELRVGMEEVISLRNNLVHYKLSEMAGKYILPPVTTTPTSDGQYMHTIDFTVKPERVEPPFIQKVSGSAAANCFNSALALINEWGKLHGEMDSVPGMQKIA